MPEVKRFWARNYKSLRDVALGFPTKLTAAADGAELDQTNMPAGVLKTFIVEAALYANPALLVVDEFENSLHPEAQQFLIDVTLSELVKSGLLEMA